MKYTRRCRMVVAGITMIAAVAAIAAESATRDAHDPTSGARSDHVAGVDLSIETDRANDPLDVVLHTRTVDAAAPDPSLCNGNSAFCGQALRIDSATGTIGSVAAGAHYGPEWAIPPTPNDSTGTGWCVDDTHTGYPSGPMVQQPLPGIWTQRQMRIAATIMALYGGDRVIPYQGLAIDAQGELVDASTPTVNATPHRHIAVWLALRSVLPDPAGTPRIDLGSARTFSDIAGRRPSSVGDAAVPLAQRMVRHAEAMAPNGAITMSVRFVDGTHPTAPGEPEVVVVRVTDADGRPLPSYPVWPSRSFNTTVTPADASDGVDVVAATNAELAGWPSFDTTGQVSGAALTDADGEATFRMEVDGASGWRTEFGTEGPPLRVRIFGDDIRAQNNVTLEDDAPPRAAAGVDGDLSLRSIRVVKRSSDPRFGVAGGEFALIDGTGVEVGRAISGPDGTADFAPFDEVAHPPPHLIREITAPPGLQPLSGDVAVPEQAGRGGAAAAEVDRRSPAGDWLPSYGEGPTVVEILNEPEQHDLVIEKIVTGASGAPDDLSDFTFTVTSTSDESFAVELVTDASGRTPALRVPASEYVVTETGRPDWWPPDQPLPSSMTVIVGVDGPATVTVSFDNNLPPPSIVTAATDATDGDRYLARSGGTIVDNVRLCGTVPGTTYTINGRLMFVSEDGTVEATEIVATTDVVSSTGDADADGDGGCVTTMLSFDVPAGSAHLAESGHFVVTEEVLVGSVVVADHDDPDSVAQTVYLVDADTLALDAADGDKTMDRSEQSSGAMVVDTLTISGLDPTGPHVALRADSELFTVDADGATTPTGASGTTEFTVGDVLDGVRPQVEVLVPASVAADIGTTAVVFTTVTDVASGLVIGEHIDPADPDQRVTWPPLTPPDATPPGNTPPDTTPEATTTTTTSSPPQTTSTPPSTTPPTTTPPTAAPPTTPPTTAPTTTGPPGEPDLPRTGGEAWRVWYRAGSLILLLGAALFFASTLGIHTPGDPRSRARRDRSRLPGRTPTREIVEDA